MAARRIRRRMRQAHHPPWERTHHPAVAVCCCSSFQVDGPSESASRDWDGWPSGFQESAPAGAGLVELLGDVVHRAAALGGAAGNLGQRLELGHRFAVPGDVAAQVVEGDLSGVQRGVLEEAAEFAVVLDGDDVLLRESVI